MSKEANQEYKFTVNSKEYQVKLHVNTLAETEKLVGFSLWGTENMGIGTVRALLYAGVKDQHGLKTLEQAGDLLDLDRQVITRTIISAYNAYFE